MRCTLLILLCSFFSSLLIAEESSPFAKWEKAISKFEEQDKTNPPPKNAILFVGSSSIRLWKLEKSFPDRRMINRGFGGSQIVDSTHFAPRMILKHRPRQIVLYAGDNDIAKGKSPEQVSKDFAAFVETIHKKLPSARIAFIAIKPSIKRWKLAEKMSQANAMIEKQCQAGDKLQYVDIWKPMLGGDGKPRAELFVKDGLHLNANGYRLWAKVLRPYLK